MQFLLVAISFLFVPPRMNDPLECYPCPYFTWFVVVIDDRCFGSENVERLVIFNCPKKKNHKSIKVSFSDPDRVQLIDTMVTQVIRLHLMLTLLSTKLITDDLYTFRRRTIGKIFFCDNTLESDWLEGGKCFEDLSLFWNLSWIQSKVELWRWVVDHNVVLLDHRTGIIIR